MRFKVFQIRKAESKRDAEHYILASSMTRAVNAVYNKYKMTTGLVFPYDVQSLDKLQLCELSDGKRKFFIKEIQDEALIKTLDTQHRIMPVDEYQ